MPIKLLNEELISHLEALFKAQLVYPIEILHFSSKQCDTCDDSRQLLDEVAHISNLIHVSNYDIHEHSQIAQKYNVHLTPGLVIAGNDRGEFLDNGIRFAGIPSGYEFGSLIQAILLVSKRDSGLKPSIRSELKRLKTPVQLQVFVTPT